MKTLVLGLGNSVRADDGVGLYVARTLQNMLDSPDIIVSETPGAGLDIIELLSGYERAILIDAIQTDRGQVGQVRRLDVSAFETTRHALNPHSADLATSLETGRRLGLPLPSKITIFAIEIADADSFSEECTPAVSMAIPVCVNMIIKELGKK
jgi:hydrogenase maturation protease